MVVTGRSDFNAGAGAVLFQDFSTEMVDTALSGNVTFAAALSGTNVQFTVTNGIGRDLSMKYLVRRWSSL
jgi:hypothetical protein